MKLNENNRNYRILSIVNLCNVAIHNIGIRNKPYCYFSTNVQKKYFFNIKILKCGMKAHIFYIVFIELINDDLRSKNVLVNIKYCKREKCVPFTKPCIYTGPFIVTFTRTFSTNRFYLTFYLLFTST